MILDDAGQVDRVVAAHDGGRIINPTLFESQIEGAVVMGLGYALSEDLPMENGQLKTKRYGKLGIPRIKTKTAMFWVVGLLQLVHQLCRPMGIQCFRRRLIQLLFDQPGQFSGRLANSFGILLPGVRHASANGQKSGPPWPVTISSRMSPRA